VALREIVGRGAAARLLAVSDSTTPFGAAHSLLRAGVAEVVPDTLDDAELGKVVSRLAASRRLTLSAPEQKEGRLIVVTHARGGVGATTFAVNLAHELGRQRRRFGRPVGPARKVVLVDLDLQFGSIASFLDLAANDALYTLVRDHLDPDPVFIDQAIEITSAGLAVLAGPSRYLPLTAVTPDQIRALLRVLRQRFDFVVVDMPQVIVDWVSPVLDAADRVQMVTGTSVPSIRQSRRLIDFYREQNPAVEIDIIVSKEKKPLLRSRRRIEAEKALGLPFRHWLPPDPRAADAAMDQGRPLSRIAPGSGLSKAVRGIAAEMLRLADAGTAIAERQL
jgi:pilus assembly protein CpaE